MAHEFYGSIEGSNELFLIYAGYCSGSNCVPGEGLRDHCFIHYVYKGSGTAMIGGKVFRIRSGDGFIVFPFQHHRYQTFSDSPWSFAWIGFSGEKAISLAESLGLSEKNPVFSIPNIRSMEKLFVQMTHTLYSRKSGKELKAKSLFYELFSRIAAKNNSYPAESVRVQNKIQVQIDKAITMVKFNFQRPINIRTIIEHTGYNRCYFAAQFKKQTGISLKKYLFEFRMKKAEEYLISTKLKINEVAASVGYEDYFNFARQFKSFAGKSPSVYRKSHRNINSK